MKIEATGINKETRESVSCVLDAADMTQARRFCRGYLNLNSVKMREAAENVAVDHDFTQVAQFLSVKQYRKIRKARGESQFPVLEVLFEQ